MRDSYPLRPPPPFWHPEENMIIFKILCNVCLTVCLYISFQNIFTNYFRSLRMQKDGAEWEQNKGRLQKVRWF